MTNTSSTQTRSTCLIICEDADNLGLDEGGLTHSVQDTNCHKGMLRQPVVVHDVSDMYNHTVMYTCKSVSHITTDWLISRCDDDCEGKGIKCECFI